ncbi:hybrid sensor histidine kinase/response regulator transcription factor [Thalassomonas actiniarum]|uniref:histidine kinase n=1 Tax=Thalassomonas actiniarum TaxID=485447 RepID=A0AAE9YP30_9GAMM|nr:two-component regulator propeller domain-containing protein [Thalassomonas actiniarum]WDD97608.1 response regulator [Thalassomonas actiniarum]
MPVFAAENILFEQANMVTSANVGSVFSIIEDKPGYLWLGSSEGLFKYDGYEFKRYLGDDSYRSLHQDPDGTLWALGSRSMKKYRPETDSFEVFSLPGDEHKLLSGFPHPQAMVQTADASLWFFAGGGQVLQYQKTDDRWRRYALFPQNSGRETLPSVPLITRKGRLLLAIGPELFTYDAVSDTFNLLLTLDQAGVSITVLEEETSGALLLGSNRGLYRYLIGTGEMLHYQALPVKTQPGKAISSNLVTRILTDKRQNIWVGTKDGLNLFDPHSGTFHRIRHPRETKVGEFVQTLAQDRSGNLWLSGLSGLYYYAPGKMRFVIEAANPDDPHSLSHPSPWSILFDSRQRLWLGTYGGGLNVKAGNDKTYRRYRHNSSNRNSLSDMSVMWMLEDSRQNIWLGTRRGLNLYREQSDDFKHFYFAPENSDAPVNKIFSLLEQEENILWLATQGGVVRTEFTADDHALPEMATHQVFLPGEVVYHIWMSSEQEIWAGTQSGLYRLNNQGQVIKHYQGEAKVAGNLSGNMVNQVYQDKKGTIWVGTENGLNKYLPQQDTFEFIPLFGRGTLAGVQNLLEDANGLLWLVTSSRGLIVMDTDKEQVLAHYTRSEGFTFAVTLHALAPDGRIYLGTLNQGLVSFYPRASREAQQIQLTRIRLDDNEILPAPGGRFYVKGDSAGDNRQEQMSAQAFAHNSKNLAFQFSNFEYARGRSVEYQYKLEGFDEQWREAPVISRLATYTNLSPGHYSFIARARLPMGRWSETRFDFFIEYPVWRSWWAYSGYLVALGVFVYLGGRVQTRVLKKRNRALEQKIALRTGQITEKNKEITALLASKNRFYSNISHEFRTPLMVMLIPIEKILASNPANKGQWQAAYHQGQRLVKMVEHLIEFANQDKKAAAVNTQYPLDSAIRQLCEAYAGMADDKAIAFHLDIQVITPQILLTRDCLEQVLGNLITNAIKYTPAKGKVRVTVTEEDAILKLAVADTGYGIAPQYQQQVFERFSRIDNPEHGQAEGIGIGLAIVKEQVELNQGSITLSSEPGKGSCFTVTLPVIAGNEGGGELSSRSTGRLDSALAAEGVAAAGDIAADVARAQDKEKEKLLIVEDNPDLRRLLSQELGSAFHCLSAKDGAEGIALAERELPDLIISDVMMPNKNGFELCQSVKQSPLTCHIPVILLTAKGDKASKMTGWQCEADDYIGKPFDIRELNCRIDNLINSRKKLAQVHKLRFLSGQTPQGHAGGEAPLLSGSDANLPLPERFIEDIKAVVEQGYTQAEFSINDMAGGLYMSSRQLQRKTKAILQISPSEYLKQFRLQQAKVYLQQNMQAASVAHRVGFSSPAYFGSCFKAQYGQTPVQYQQSCVDGQQLACR